MTIIIKIRKLPMICDEGNYQWVTSGLTWGTLIITMDITKKPIHAAATPFSLPSKSIYKTLRKSGEHGVNIRKNIKKLLKIN
jgi:hypothetical protein